MGAGGYDPGELVENSSRLLTREQTDKFLRKVDRAGFWKLPGYDHVMGCDGSQWIIEGVKDGKYHLVDRWSPGKGPIHELGVALALNLAHLKIPKDQIY